MVLTAMKTEPPSKVFTAKANLAKGEVIIREKEKENSKLMPSREKENQRKVRHLSQKALMSPLKERRPMIPRTVIPRMTGVPTAGG